MFVVGVNAVRFNVAQLLKSAPGASREHELEEDISGIDKDVEVSKPLVGKVKLLHTGDGILVTGHLRTEACVPCRRCLADALVSVELHLEEQFRPSVDIITGQPLPLEGDQEEATRIDAHHILDLTEMVRQNILLALPMSALCKAECRGLCPECGQNINDGPCDCQPAEGDSRLSVLRELL